MCDIKIIIGLSNNYLINKLYLIYLIIKHVLIDKYWKMLQELLDVLAALYFFAEIVCGYLVFGVISVKLKLVAV